MTSKRTYLRDWRADAKTIKAEVLANPDAHFVPADAPGDEGYLSTWLGTVYSLDPCGKFHYTFGDAVEPAECRRYWDAAEDAVSEAGGWLDYGEAGDDVFVCFPLPYSYVAPDVDPFGNPLPDDECEVCGTPVPDAHNAKAALNPVLCPSCWSDYQQSLEDEAQPTYGFYDNEVDRWALDEGGR